MRIEGMIIGIVYLKAINDLCSTEYVEVEACKEGRIVTIVTDGSTV